MKEGLLAVGFVILALALTAIGIAVVVGGLVDGGGLAARLTFVVAGMTILTAAALGTRAVFKDDARRAAQLLVLPLLGCFLMVFGGLMELAEALCDSGDCPEPTATGTVLYVAGAGLVLGPVALGLRWLWRSSRSRDRHH